MKKTSKDIRQLKTDQKCLCRLNSHIILKVALPALCKNGQWGLGARQMLNLNVSPSVTLMYIPYMVKLVLF